MCEKQEGGGQELFPVPRDSSNGRPFTFLSSTKIIQVRSIQKVNPQEKEQEVKKDLKTPSVEIEILVLKPGSSWLVDRSSISCPKALQNSS
jgi:hypothetical protein